MRCFLLLYCIFPTLTSFSQSETSTVSADDNVSLNVENNEVIDAVMKIQKVADSLFLDRKYNKSISLFKRIARLNPENSYAKAKIKEINLLLVNLEKTSSERKIEKTSTSEIIFKAKNIQEKRIEMNRNYYANRKAP